MRYPKKITNNKNELQAIREIPATVITKKRKNTANNSTQVFFFKQHTSW